jgi:hypothetical protein
LRQPVTTTGTRNELTPTKEHTMKITTTDGTVAQRRDGQRPDR